MNSVGGARVRHTVVTQIRATHSFSMRCDIESTPQQPLHAMTNISESNSSNARKISPKSGSHRLALVLTILATVATVSAQTASEPAPSPSTLARYDQNKDGRIDATEQAAINANDARAANSSVRPSGGTDGEKVVEISPFEVVDDNKGYYAANTMSGTRINSKLEDLASSITVVTKQQMSDFAMLDINDVFAYQAGTEGSGTYTDFSFNSSAQPQDNLSSSPNTANRVRGLSSANIAYGGFETSRRVPIDPITTDGLEISRGPNSILFGLGNAAGTANSIPSAANLRRSYSQVQFRGDSYGTLNDDGGYRESIDVNRVLIRDKLAIRVSQLFQETKFVLKPSGVRDERYNAMVKYRPFKSTTISASYLYYHQYGRRPNSVTPRDAISQWTAAGSPSWDPRTNTAYINGSPVNNTGAPVSTLGGGIPVINGTAVFSSAYQTTGRGSSLMYIDQYGVSYWTAPRGTTTGDALLTTTAANNQAGFNLALLAPNTVRRVQPLWGSDAAVSSKSIYDWSKINTSAMNSFYNKTLTSLVTLDQVILDTPRNLLAAQLGWFREDSPQNYRDAPNGSSASTYLYLDPNINRLDGSTNPFYLRPYLGVAEGNVFSEPLLNDTYRAQLAYKLDLTHEKSWMKWLGLHNFTGFGEYKHFESRRYISQLAILDNHTWLSGSTPRANSALIPGDTLPQDAQSPTGSRSFRFYYVGDNKGNNVDYAPYSGNIDGTYNYTWGNFAAGTSINEPTRAGLAATINGTAGAANSLKIQKTEGGVWQGHFINDRLVTTFGLRKDRVDTKAGVTARLLPDGVTHDYAWDRQWAPGNYSTNEGKTRTAGAVLKITSWLDIYANRSNSFIPADSAINLHGQALPNPQGKGEDWGLALHLFRNKLHIKANQYITKTLNDRAGNSTTYAQRALKVDIFDGQVARNFSLDVRSRQWIQNAAGGTLTSAQLDAAVASTMKIDPGLLSLLQTSVASGFTAPAIAEASESLSKGREIEVFFNPSDYWTIAGNVTQTEAFQSAIAPDLLAYLAERTPVWQSIIDQDTKQNWFTSSYAGGQSAMAYLPANVTTPLNLAQQTVGKTLPQIRKYNAKVSTSYQLRGITDHRYLKNATLGGAVRWEDKGAIGYYGVQKLPAIITDLDKNAPIYDKAHSYFDAFASYRTKMFSNKVGTTFQFNVKNIQEGGRLQPVSAFPDGTPNAYRIVDPRQFILTVTFDL